MDQQIDLLVTFFRKVRSLDTTRSRHLSVSHRVTIVVWETQSILRSLRISTTLLAVFPPRTMPRVHPEGSDHRLKCHSPFHFTYKW